MAADLKFLRGRVIAQDRERSGVADHRGDLAVHQ
jgi:hypothetical protein